jgi:hypothetical protein
MKTEQWQLTYWRKKIKDRLTAETVSKKTLTDTKYDVEGENLRTTSWTRSAKGYHQKESVREFKVDTEIEHTVPCYET